MDGSLFSRDLGTDDHRAEVFPPGADDLGDVDDEERDMVQRDDV
jgi:hypothetical protein